MLEIYNAVYQACHGGFPLFPTNWLLLRNLNRSSLDTFLTQ